MTTQKILSAVAIALFATATFTSCKKDKKEPLCQLTSASVIASGGSDNYSFTYNSDNKVNQIVEVSGGTTTTTTLAYSGNIVNITSRELGVIEDLTILTLNSDGRVIREENRDPNTNSITSYTNYTYASNGELTSSTSKYGTDPEDFSIITTTNGNISSISNDGDVTTLDYITDQTWRAGDYLDIIQRLNNGNNFYFVNKNLVKSVASGGNINNFSYTYGENNTITQMKIISGGTSTDVNYVHECK